MDRVVETITPKKLPTMQIKRVCAYARVSYDKDTMIHSLSAQISYYQDYIQSHICADCGSFYGPKVWHSTDKYKKVV
jgi:hypothetical protein